MKCDSENLRFLILSLALKHHWMRVKMVHLLNNMYEGYFRSSLCVIGAHHRHSESL